MDTVGEVILEIEKARIPALIIPGGGIFADEVRSANLDDDTSHWDAINSMNRYGIFLSTFGVKLTDEPEIPQSSIQILMPEKILKKEDPLPHSWEVTSDSIALWVAEKLQVPLLLIKSRSGTLYDGLVDRYFPILQKNTAIPVHLACGRYPGEVRQKLAQITATLL